jgi:integrase/recombinase XerD
VSRRGETDHLYQRGEAGTWWLRYRGVRRSLQTANVALAREKRAEVIRQIDRERLGLPRYRWSDAVVKWHEEVASRSLGRSTVARYLSSLRMVDLILGPLYLDEIGKAVIARVAARAPTNASRRRDLTAVSAVLDAAEGWGWVERNISHDFNRRRIRERRDPIVLPTDAEVDRLVSMAPPMLAAMIRLLEHAGMRLEEAASLQWRQVDLNRRTLTLERTKARKIRVVTLNDAAIAALSAVTRHLQSPWVFWHGQLDPRRYDKPAQRLAQLRKAAGVRWRTHDLRHLFAVRWLKEGRSIYRLQQELGHGSLGVTEIYLAYLTPEEAERARATA